MQTFVKEVIGLLGPGERRSLLILLGMFLLAAPIEVIGLAAIFPLLDLISNPDAIKEKEYLSFAYNTLGFTSPLNFLITLTAGLFVVVVIRAIFTGFLSYATTRFAEMRHYSLSSRLLEAYLARPYAWFLGRNSADLSKSVLHETNLVVSGVMMPLLQLLSQSILVFSVFIFVLTLDIFAALVVIFAFGGVYASVYWFSRRFLSRMGEERLVANRTRYQMCQEAFSGIKDIKVYGLERVYAGFFRRPARQMASLQIKKSLFSIIPNIAIQISIYGGVLLALTILLVVHGNDIRSLIPTLGVYVLAGYRIRPAIKQIFRTFMTFQYNRPSLQQVYDDLTALERGAQLGNEAKTSYSSGETDGFHDKIELKDISYAFPNTEKASLKNINLVIPRNAFLGIVGYTGAGKTTLVDILLGLLRPDSGQILVDGKDVSRSGKTFLQKIVGYVPQNIFLADDTVAKNIAFGEPDHKVDMAAVERAARAAHLEDFVRTELPHSFNTQIGESGVRLSGGQRQRIGIARALYGDPQIVIFDEATSALDTHTEKSVMSALANLGQSKTIVMIAHRISTLYECDKIIVMDKGKIVSEGSFENLGETCPVFQSMVNPQSDKGAV